jgi:hypothetical protein
MLGVKVNFSRYVDNSFPGWVEFRLVDALGHEHVFEEKVPVVTTDDHLDAASTYPQPGVIACAVLGRSESDDGHQLVHIKMQWGIESMAGRSRFDVFPEQLVEFNLKQ